MTDKEKFRKEVEKLKSNLIHGACSSQVAMENRCKEEAYNEVLAILDTMQNQHVKESAEIQHEDKPCEDNGNSLTQEPTSWLDEFRAKLDSLSKEEFEQLWEKYGVEEKEEPVSSIWHDASEKSNEPEDVVIINPSDNTGEVLTNCTGVYSGRIWSYTSDLLNLDNPCKIGKNLQEEPVSEELEEAIGQSFIYHENRGDDFRSDKQIETAYRSGFEFGAKWKEQQMMNNSISKSVCLSLTGPYVELDQDDIHQLGLLFGDKIKLIAIKEG